MVREQNITDPDDAPHSQITDGEGDTTNNNLDKIPSHDNRTILWVCVVLSVVLRTNLTSGLSQAQLEK